MKQSTKKLVIAVFLVILLCYIISQHENRSNILFTGFWTIFIGALFLKLYESDLAQKKVHNKSKKNLRIKRNPSLGNLVLMALAVSAGLVAIWFIYALVGFLNM